MISKAGETRESGVVDAWRTEVIAAEAVADVGYVSRREKNMEVAAIATAAAAGSNVRRTWRRRRACAAARSANSLGWPWSQSAEKVSASSCERGSGLSFMGGERSEDEAAQLGAGAREARLDGFRSEVKARGKRAHLDAGEIFFLEQRPVGGGELGECGF